MRTILKPLFLLVLLLGLSLSAQEKPDFWEDVQQFKQLDAEKAAPKDAILLLGSSSFTKWKDVDAYFPGKTFINRAFGGSRLVDLNHYATDLLIPYHPKQVLIYCGENDIAHEEKPSSEVVFKRFKQFFNTVSAQYPKANIAYVSIKYSPSREQYWPVVSQVNNKIKEFLQSRKNADFIDITEAMNDENGNVRKELFLQDQLHMKPTGYEIWARAMKPFLK